MKPRLSFVPVRMFESIWWVQGNWKDNINGLRRVKSESDYNLMSITKLLFVLRDGKLSFSDLFYGSGARHKTTFLKNINLIIEMNLVTKNRDGINMFYSLTDKGRLFLDLVSSKK